MRIIIVLILLSCWLKPAAQVVNSSYDKKLADSLKADDYGMRSYVLVILKTGPSQVTDKTILDSLFRGHMSNIGEMAANGKLAVAGPIGKNEQKVRGIFILAVKTIDEAKALVEKDPTIREKVLEAEYFPWYGSAALPMYLPYHEQIQKVKM